MQTRSHRGLTLVETLFYVAGVVLLVGIITTILLNTRDWYRAAIVYPRINYDGGLLVSKIENNIRAGTSLITAQNIFNSPNGSIGINAVDSSNNTVTHHYYLQGGRILYQINSGTPEYVSPDNLYISKLQFNEINTPVSTAVRFVIDIDFMTKNGTSTNTYSSLAIMRNTYN